MKRIQGFEVSRMLLAALCMVLIAGVAQAQSDLSSFVGKFTLTNQVLWGETVLSPGDYTIAVGSVNGSNWVLVRDAKGRPIARFMGGIDRGKKCFGNALLVSERSGQLHVHSLALASLGKVLVYDPASARQAVLEARAPQKIQLTATKW